MRRVWTALASALPLVVALIALAGTIYATNQTLEDQADARKEAVERAVDARLLEERRAVYIRFRQEAQNQRNYLRSLTGYSDDLARGRGLRSGGYKLEWLAHRELRLAEVNQAMGAAMTEVAVYADEGVLDAAREVKAVLHDAETLASAQLDPMDPDPDPPDKALVDRIREVNVTLQACVRAMRNELAPYLELEPA